MSQNHRVTQREQAHRSWAIRLACADDLTSIQHIERCAGQRFAGIGMEEIASDEPPSLSDLRRFRESGLAWVAAVADGVPVAYLVAEPLDQSLHIEQVSVHPEYARLRIGRALIEEAAQGARAAGFRSLTLTTFAEVPWNAPYYATLGFAALPEHEWTVGLRAIRARESSLGLDRWPRVCMKRPL